MLLTFVDFVNATFCRPNTAPGARTAAYSLCTDVSGVHLFSRLGLIGMGVKTLACSAGINVIRKFVTQSTPYSPEARSFVLYLQHIESTRFHIRYRRSLMINRISDRICFEI